MILNFVKENYKVIIFFVVFAVGLNLFVLGVCYMIPEKMRTGGWFVAADYVPRHNNAIIR